MSRQRISSVRTGKPVRNYGFSQEEPICRLGHPVRTEEFAPHQVDVFSTVLKDYKALQPKKSRVSRGCFQKILSRQFRRTRKGTGTSSRGTAFLVWAACSECKGSDRINYNVFFLPLLQHWQGADRSLGPREISGFPRYGALISEEGKKYPGCILALKIHQTLARRSSLSVWPSLETEASEKRLKSAGPLLSDTSDWSLSVLGNRRIGHEWR